MSYTPLSPLYSTTPDEAWGQAINNNFNWLDHQRPFVKADATLQNVLADDPTTLAFGFTSGTVALWSGSRVEIPADYGGLYLVTFGGGSTSDTTGSDRRYARILLNDTRSVALRQSARSLDGTHYWNITTLLRLEEGDTLDGQVYQDTTNTLSYYAVLNVMQVGP